MPETRNRAFHIRFFCRKSELQTAFLGLNVGWGLGSVWWGNIQLMAQECPAAAFSERAHSAARDADGRDEPEAPHDGIIKPLLGRSVDEYVRMRHEDEVAPEQPGAVPASGDGTERKRKLAFNADLGEWATLECAAPPGQAADARTRAQGPPPLPPGSAASAVMRSGGEGAGAAGQLLRPVPPVPAPETFSKYAGVSWDRHVHKWKAAITVDRAEVPLCYADDEVEAARQYDQAAAPLGRPVNFPAFLREAARAVLPPLQAPPLAQSLYGGMPPGQTLFGGMPPAQSLYGGMPGYGGGLPFSGYMVPPAYSQGYHPYAGCGYPGPGAGFGLPSYQLPPHYNPHAAAAAAAAAGPMAHLGYSMLDNQTAGFPLDMCVGSGGPFHRAPSEYHGGVQYALQPPAAPYTFVVPPAAVPKAVAMPKAIATPPAAKLQQTKPPSFEVAGGLGALLEAAQRASYADAFDAQESLKKKLKIGKAKHSKYSPPLFPPAQLLVEMPKFKRRPIGKTGFRFVIEHNFTTKSGTMYNGYSLQFPNIFQLKSEKAKTLAGLVEYRNEVLRKWARDFTSLATEAAEEWVQALDTQVGSAV